METVPSASVQKEYHQPLLVPVWLVVMAVAVVAVSISAVTAASATVQTLLTLISIRLGLWVLGGLGGADMFMRCASCDGSTVRSMPEQCWSERVNRQRFR